MNIIEAIKSGYTFRLPKFRKGFSLFVDDDGFIRYKTCSHDLTCDNISDKKYIIKLVLYDTDNISITDEKDILYDGEILSNEWELG